MKDGFPTGEISNYQESPTYQHLKPGETINLENTTTENVEIMAPKFNRIQQALMSLGAVYLPKPTYVEKQKQTLFLFVSPDVLSNLQEQVPTYYADLEKYKNKMELLQKSKTVSPRDIETAISKRQPTIAQELETRHHHEIDMVNDANLESPPRPVLLGNSANLPQVIVLEETAGIGAKITLSETRHLSESNHQTGVEVEMISDSNQLSFNTEPMQAGIGYSRSLENTDTIAIGTPTSRELVLKGLGPNRLSVNLRK